MSIEVDLPTDALIEVNDLCRAVAKALCPANDDDIVGIDCIVGKIVTLHIPVPEFAYDAPDAPQWQCVLTADDGKTLDQMASPAETTADCVSELSLFASAPPPITEVSFPYALTRADREELSSLLPHLPRLHCPISDEQAEAFNQAYLRLANRPAWLPALITQSALDRRKAEQDHLFDQHRAALQDEFSSGLITAVDARHLPVKALSIGALLPRPQALQYLERHGLVCHVSEEPAPSQESKAESLAQTVDTLQPSTPVRVSSVALPSATPEQKAAAVKYFLDLKRKGVRNYAARTAAQYGVSTRTINEWVRQHAERTAKAVNPFLPSVKEPSLKRP